VVEDTNGVSDFDSLPSAMKHQPHRLALYAFDLLHLDGQDLRQRELVERRAMLSEIIKPVLMDIGITRAQLLEQSLNHQASSSTHSRR